MICTHFALFLFRSTSSDPYFMRDGRRWDSLMAQTQHKLFESIFLFYFFFEWINRKEKEMTSATLSQMADFNGEIYCWMAQNKNDKSLSIESWHTHVCTSLSTLEKKKNEEEVEEKEEEEKQNQKKKEKATYFHICIEPIRTLNFSKQTTSFSKLLKWYSKHTWTYACLIMSHHKTQYLYGVWLCANSSDNIASKITSTQFNEHHDNIFVVIFFLCFFVFVFCLISFFYSHFATVFKH